MHTIIVDAIRLNMTLASSFDIAMTNLAEILLRVKQMILQDYS